MPSPSSTIPPPSIPDDIRQQTFQDFKAICVPLMASSSLSLSSIPRVSQLLTDLIKLLRDINEPVHLTPSLMSYIFFPLSTILRRNPSSAIPDQILEKLFTLITSLCEHWWWTCDLTLWEQIFMLCGAVIGGIESTGKTKDRDEETKEAATRCLLSLLRERTLEDALLHSLPATQAQSRKVELVSHTQSEKFVPILGQVLDSVLLITQSPNLDTQLVSLEVTHLLLDVYAPDYLIPSVLPGVVSSMTKVALGTSKKKGWANGDLVAAALKIMQIMIVKAISDDVCTQTGALNQPESLEALAALVSGIQPEIPQHQLPPYSTHRTPSWLRATSSQLHIAISSLTPLISHPTPSAHLALVRFSATVLEATPFTLSQSQPLLMRFLLSFSNSDLPAISGEAQDHLHKLCTAPSAARDEILQTLMQIAKDNLLNLPRLLPSMSETRVQHAAGLVTAICHLASTGDNASGVPLVSSGIGKLLGQMGGVERWGWTLMSVLIPLEPKIIAHTSVSRLMLENDPHASDWPVFPRLMFKNVASANTIDALETMFQALGYAGGDNALFTVEWFINAGLTGRDNHAVTAMWCACRLLEGIASISLSERLDCNKDSRPRSQWLERLARALAKDAAEIWNDTTIGGNDTGVKGGKTKNPDTHDDLVSVEHVRGIIPVHETLNIMHTQTQKPPRPRTQRLLHRALTLQLLAITAGILQSQFPSLFIQTLYPVLHSIISTDSFLSLTALATLKYITMVTSYASPANLILSNFDYALDSVARRLTRRWLDMNATKVLLILIRLVGSDIVERASDVVEECFDRLDEYHGYPQVVEGLVEVLGEVIQIIRSDFEAPSKPSNLPPSMEQQYGVEAFVEWYGKPGNITAARDGEEYGPAPRTAWCSNNKTDGSTVSEDQGDNTKENPSSNPINALTQQIVSRSMYFLTHGSPAIRAQILKLLAHSAAVLPEPALMPSIHSAWPFVLNRLSDSEPFVISAAASLIETLTIYAGDSMFRRIWDDVWPRFERLLNKLDAVDSQSALARRGYGAIGTESAYTHSHRLYRSIIKTMTAAIQGVHPHELSVWHVSLAFRRFLNGDAHEELQKIARDLYVAIASRNADIVWLALFATSKNKSPITQFLWQAKWNIEANVEKIYDKMDQRPSQLPTDM
ncbi:hypothetical protein AMATHDRAFT_76065 [Amanita thiersii Skay4041]|uniref:Uncharacterized protein n=1 Tax=Amanita thiersii Skay4041 TaxID=703135 RepID=A0A2A9NHZ0_9AGAR|nr:hypothetical protein AMATHDRAFT_76065 [Amanita thiersii Skay4041]